jgi:tetratricopeptide (TPR) repeat protein
MIKYQKINNAVGWIVLIVSTAVYWLTAEPTGSFWDCGEFIACAYKLQVPHSPGAPLFILIAHLFTLFAPDAGHVALTVNYFSGLTSAFTNLFLFWSITALGRKILGRKEHEVSTAETIALMGAGLVGAFANCFADSFWFSAVEGEVYAFSSFFTAIVFWAILKWDQVADEPYADRWILFIGYMMGLAVGVHLLGLLAIPALVMLYYFRKFKPTRWGIIKAFVVGILILGFIQYGIIPQIPNLSTKFDILFVNSFGLPFNSGVAFFFVVMVGLVVYGLYYAQQKNKYVLHTAILTGIFIVIGYSTYFMIVIRSNANPAINMGAPDNPISLLSYLNREQYGDHPLLYGQTFIAQPIDFDRESGDMRYYQDRETGRYIELGRKPIIKYADRDKMLFPRIWDNDDPSHIRFYRSWLGLKENEKPTFADNMNFFFTYQVGFMYWRYFLWNFSGRQNDIQGDGDIRNGNWITGFPFIDNKMLGDQTNLPTPLKENKGRNKFYLIPFALGILGALYHFRKSKYDAFVVLLFFFFTGLAIVIYLNQPPQQPRERDYAYAGSVYAFAIWIGISVLWLYELLQKRTSATTAAVAGTAIAALAPVLMGAGGWDDHDRSKRYTARDMGRNYLESCAPNAILFTQGDNDTYPLWYAQEVEGIRPDVKIVNLSLLGVDWYIDHLRRKTNESEPVIISVDSAAYRGSKRDYLRYFENKSIPQNEFYSLNSVMEYLFTEDPRKMVDYAGEKMNYVPARNLYIPVNKQEVIALGVVQPTDTSRIVSRVEWRLNKSTLLKNDIMTLEILRQNLWKRPIYFAISVAPDAYLGLNNYFQQEGLTYRLVPYVAKKGDDGLPGGVQPDIMYNNMMNKFRWGGVDQNEVYLDENVLRMVTNLRSNFARLSTDLIARGRMDSALQVLDKAQEVLPEKNVPVAINSIAIGKNYFEAGAPEKGKELLQKCYNVYSDQLRYYTGLDESKRQYFNEDISNGLYVMNSIATITRNQADSALSVQAQETFNKYLMFYTPPEK